MKKLKIFSSSLILMGAMATTSLANAETAVIVHPDNPIGELDSKGIQDIYLGKKKRYPGGSVAVPIDHNGDPAIRSGFNSSVLGKDASQLKSYWAQRIFTGKGQPPKRVNGDVEVKKLVAKNPAIIGYVDASSVDDTVKVIYKF